jgi:hypothetical protein
MNKKKESKKQEREDLGIFEKLQKRREIRINDGGRKRPKERPD